MSCCVLQYIRHTDKYTVNLPLDISHNKGSFSSILPYITWGLIWNLKTKNDKRIPTGKIEISQTVRYLCDLIGKVQPFVV